MSKRAEERAQAYENGLDYYHYTGDNPSVAYKAGYEQAEKDILKDARWIEICEDTTWKMVEDFIHQNMDGAYRVIIVKD